MTNFADRLWEDLVRDHGPALGAACLPDPGQRRLLRRPRLLAGGTLGLAGAGGALALALSFVGGPAAAYAVATTADGTVTVTLNQLEALPQANARLAAMGTGEQITIQMAAGAATVAGPVTCSASTSVSGPSVRALVGGDGTETLPAGNTGAGTWHLASCRVLPIGGASSGASGNS